MNVPNKLTVLRILLIPVFLLVIVGPFDWGMIEVSGISISLARIVAMFIFVVASLTDWLDGYLARQWNLVTNFGKFADPLADKMLVMTAFIVLVALNQAPAWIVSIIVMRELAVTGLRLLLVEDGEVIAAAWPGKIKTATQMFAIIFLLLEDLPFSLFTSFSVSQLLLYLSLIFTMYSGVDYFIKNREVFQGSM
ncbi:MAG: CDP-diacylglycerol--glycerol-3-phosphate 3-phosphatidyltransferase [Lactobacillales bacterium]|jgi:CDP-diacylglycerol--glycerol-3-phosphate 3-phosphatidyltransferase|nr:CDP-diacylglycerol--glycerol-3-phosphate 3-phosphatidyltransferase [Lactobacillales bacterium]